MVRSGIFRMERPSAIFIITTTIASLSPPRRFPQGIPQKIIEKIASELGTMTQRDLYRGEREIPITGRVGKELNQQV